MRADHYFYYEKVVEWDRLVPLFAEADDAAQPAATASSWRITRGDREPLEAIREWPAETA